MESGLPKAVFLSYAREDADAVRRIADALRSQGVEVWFDQSELRGGDAWDAKIRRQIDDCSLFVPIISSNTQQRPKGYFRLEWKLGVDQMHLHAEGAPFLAPIVIDDTRESGAVVPPDFLRVQWTRLPGGLATPQFLEHVKRLLAGHGHGPAPVQVSPVSKASASLSKPRGLGWLWSAIAVAGAAAAVLIALRKPANVPVLPASPPPSAANEKSIAVLAFANLSEERANEYFSDGISEEILDILAKVPGLRVAGRTSSFYFKGHDAAPQEIGRTLHVANLLDGSVQRVGNRVRIVATLSRADSGEQIWSQTYTRELNDAFALEDDVAGDIAQQLRLKLGGASATPRQVDPEAHRLVLEGRYFWNLRTEDGFARAEADFKRALTIDPGFAPAHAGLAEDYVIRAYYRLVDGYLDSDDDVERGKQEAERALALDHNSEEAYATLGYVLMMQGRPAEAERAYATALGLNPNSAIVMGWHANLEEQSGRLDLALEDHRHANKLDPLWFIAVQFLAADLDSARLSGEALAVNERAAALRQDVFPVNQGEKAFLLLQLGRVAEALAAARWMEQNVDRQPRLGVDGLVAAVLVRSGHRDEAEKYAAQLFHLLPPDSYVRGSVLVALGRFPEALPYLKHCPPSARKHLFYDQIYDPWRTDARFQQLIVELGCATEYKVARATLTRMMAAKSS